MKLYVWYFNPTNELILSTRKGWPKTCRGFNLYTGGSSWDSGENFWFGAKYLAKHQFEFLGEL